MSAAVRALEREREKLTARLQRLAARTDELEAEMQAVETEREQLAQAGEKLDEAIATVRTLAPPAKARATKASPAPAAGTLGHRILGELAGADGLGVAAIAKTLKASQDSVRATLGQLRRRGFVEALTPGVWRATGLVA